MRKKILAIVMAVLMVISLMPMTVFAASSTVNTWDELQTAITSAGSEKTTVTLGNNITCGNPDNTNYINIPSGANITLDLNGKTIDRGLGSADFMENGFVIKVESGATLTLEDGKQGGKITGGNSTDFGGGISVEGILIMKSGSISGNNVGKATQERTYYGSGGGVYIADGGSFTMDGGSVSNNTAIYAAGVSCLGEFILNSGTLNGNIADDAFNNAAACAGVRVGSTMDGILVEGSFVMNGGSITDNSCPDNGAGGVEVILGSFIMNFGVISGNYSAFAGGGVIVYNGSFEMYGGEISGNTASWISGGVMFSEDEHSTLTLGGTAKITGNKAGAGLEKETDSDLGPQKAIIIADGDKAPTSEMSIGVICNGLLTMQAGNAFTSSGEQEEYLDYFFADEDNYYVKYEGGHFLIEEIPEGSYKIKTAKCENGKIVADKKIAASGETVTLTVTPDSGYSLKADTLKVTPTGGIPINPTFVGNNKYTFVMPNSPVIISAEFASGICTVTYIGDDSGTVMVDNGGSVTLPVCSEKGYHYEFTSNGVAWDGTNITADTTVTVTKTPNIYTVSFSTNGHGTAPSEIKGVAYNTAITAPTPAPTADGYTFGGWYLDKSCKQPWNFKTDVVTKNIVLYAKWIENSKAPITVNDAVIKGNNGDNDKVKVELYKGTDLVVSTQTDENGKYNLGTIPAGVYNLVVTNDEKVTTTLLIVESESIPNVTIPDKDVGSKVEFTGEEVKYSKINPHQIVVGGLDEIAKSMNPKPGEFIDVKLLVEPKEDEGTPEQKAIKKEAGSGLKVEFLDMSLLMQINGGIPNNIGGDNDKLLTIVIPFNFSNVDADSVVIIRNHNGSTDRITTEPNEYGEYFEADYEANMMTLYAMKFSEYAVAYNEKTTEEPTDPTDPTEPIDPTDPTEPIDPTDPTEPIDPTEPTDPTDPIEKPIINQKTTSTPTGDMNGMLSWIMILALAGTAIVVMFARSRDK